MVDKMDVEEKTVETRLADPILFFSKGLSLTYPTCFVFTDFSVLPHQV